MPDDAALQTKLKQSQESRIRAWKALRGVISVLSDGPLPAPSKPACFETEGAVLKKSLVKVLGNLRRDLESVQQAVEKIRPFIGAKESAGLSPDAIIQLNRAALKLGEWTGTLAFTEGKCR